MLIEIHMIQNHSPSNLNRDDLGAPKTCIFGGVMRARMSSQCLKRSIRNPGNPDDIHTREPGMFAEAMAGYMGTRTKFFPWLVEQSLLNSNIPEKDRPRIVLAAQRIATTKEKEGKKRDAGAKTDPRPKTAQLIHLGPGHANYFVNKLDELSRKDDTRDQYEYFLSPEVGFQEMVRELLAESGLPDKEQEKIVKASWTIAKCRMSELLKSAEGDESDFEFPPDADQSELEQAIIIAERLTDLRLADENQFNKLIRARTRDEKAQIKEDAPKKPPKMDEFMQALKSANRYDAVDVALFGRMTTSEAFQDVEAAMQVAHAISTHAAFNEVDYWTAVDDLGKTGGGAGHVDEGMFTSACFYKYFCLDWKQLVDNLAGPEPNDASNDAEEKKPKAYEESKGKYRKIRENAERLAACTLGHFIRAAALTTPSGKQNSFAANNEPCGILIEIKKNANIPTSYANAFAEPVERIGKPDDDAADEKSIEGRSVACLADHVQSMQKAYGINSKLLWYSPKLWRFPLQYWERSVDGKKTKTKLVTEHRFHVLGGEDPGSEGLIEAVIEELEINNLKWADVQDSGKTSAKES